jgi:hypothetical protein
MMGLVANQWINEIYLEGKGFKVQDCLVRQTACRLQPVGVG